MSFPQAVLQQLVQHVESHSSQDTYQVIFDWAASKLKDERLASRPSSSGQRSNQVPPSPTTRSAHPPSNGHQSASNGQPPAPPANQPRRGSALNTPAANSLFTSGPFGVDSTPLMSVSEDDNNSQESSPSQPAFPSSSAFSSSNSLNNHLNTPSFPPGFSAGRRTSVSAESLIPTSSSGAGGPGGGDRPKLPVYPKSAQQLSRIELSIASNFLFRNLDDEQKKDVLGAMKEKKVQPGEMVIEQGAVGDFFYIVEEGSLDVYIKQVDTPNGELGKKVFTNTKGTSFGDLALMYNAPRTASIVANSPSILWALDRITFRTILLDHTSSKRKMYESFLSSIEILKGLEPYERAKIADALETRTYEAGQTVIVQGEIGEDFFLIESGRAEILKTAEGSTVEMPVAEYGKGNYFGELALINRVPRAATVRAIGGKLRVATLSEKAFTRLLGPTQAIMARQAGERYGLQ